jgi:lipopolysaccharide/colanic/teichoic acid biosynthesis glycosyltransferase
MYLEYDVATPGSRPLGDRGWTETTAADRRRRGPGGRSWYLPCRAAAEFTIALVLLVLTTPAILLAAALVRLTSRGPAFYNQTRLGRGGRSYTMYKIRSMYHDCERHSGICWATKCDPRITPLGRVLRFTHLDELPQLWNVLKGDMSLIGPRPERPELVPDLERDIPRYRERLSVRPGVTGLAQVQQSADTGLESVRRKLAYDLYYIEAMGPWLDLRILLSTALKMVGVPFPVLRKLFAMPSCDEVEGTYRSALPAVPQVQPA